MTSKLVVQKLVAGCRSTSLRIPLAAGSRCPSGLFFFEFRNNSNNNNLMHNVIYRRGVKTKKRSPRFTNAGSGRIKRRGEHAFDYKSPSTQNNNTAGGGNNTKTTLGEQLGWKPIAFLLLAPIFAWGALYTFRPGYRAQMRESMGLGNGTTETLAAAASQNSINYEQGDSKEQP